MAEFKADLVGDSSDLVKSIDNVGKALDKVVDDIEELPKEGDRAESALEANFRDIAKSAKKYGDDAGDNMKKGIKDGLKEAGSEAGASGREGAASFAGGFDDVADFIQETLANALAGFGPAGAAAGVALAATLGAVLASASAAQEKLAEAREKAVDLASVIYENGGKIPLEARIDDLLETLGSERLARNPIESLANDFIDLGTGLDATRRAAKDAKVPVEQAMEALTGTDLDQTKATLEAVNDELERMATESGNVDFGDWTERKADLEGYKSALEGVVTQGELAQELVSSSTFLKAQAAAEHKAEVEAIGAAWQNAMIDAGDYVTESEEGVTGFDWGSYLADAEATLAAANEYKRQILTVPDDIKTEAERLFAENGAQAAAAYLTAYDQATAANKARFVAAAAQNGTDAGTAQGEAMAASAESTARSKAQGWGPLVMPVVGDTAELEAAIARIKDNPANVVRVIVRPGMDEWF